MSEHLLFMLEVASFVLAGGLASNSSCFRSVLILCPCMRVHVFVCVCVCVCACVCVQNY